MYQARHTHHGSRGIERRIPGLDVVRGIAIGIVVLHHAWPGAFGSAGAIGVVIFFALSGYLITGILERDIARTGIVSFRRFYRNRVLRLGPALVALLIAFATVELTTNRVHDQQDVASTVALALTYTADLPIGHISPAMSHLWSLAVEEQFYLIWPSLLIFAVRRGMTTNLVRWLLPIALLITAASTVVIHTDQARLYQLPTSWSMALLLGAAAYLFREAIAARMRHADRLVAVVAIMILAGMCLIPDEKASPLLYLVIAPASAMLSVALIFSLINMSGWVARMTAPIQWLGRISYATYLWNFLIVMWITAGSDSMSTSQAVGSIALTLVAGTASWWFIERWALKLKKHFDARTSAPSSLVTADAIH